MEKFFVIFKLGVKYLYRYRRRYGFLLAALIFGFAVVTFITSMRDGMYENVYYTAQSHYAGDIVALGYENYPSGIYHRLGQDEIPAILDAAVRAGVESTRTVLRTICNVDGVVYFNGTAVQLKYVMGCDWENESPLFARMSFEQPPELPSLGDSSIILSAPVADRLGAKMGDSVVMEARTRWGQKNTAAFIVEGIVRDTSIFGYYKAYVSRLSLNRLIVYDDDDCSSVGFFLDNPARAEQERGRLQACVEERLQTGPLVFNRDEMAIETMRPWERIKVFLYTMPVYLSEISELLDAMNIITYFLYGMMLLIILVSAAVTYRLILHERARELGIMRVIGFYGGDLRLVLWAEIIVLCVIALAAGFLLALVSCRTVSRLSFAWLPAFEIFMKDGKLSALFKPGTTLVNMALIFLAVFVLALAPSFRASRKNLPSLLSGDPL